MKYTVLLVEDDPSDQLMVTHAFAKVAPQVQLKCVGDGLNAIRYLSSEEPYRNRDAHPLPHVVLLDLKLPLKSGFEVLAWIRRQPSFRQLPVIVLTSSSESKDVDRAYELGANSYIVKSVDVATLRDVVKGIGDYAALIMGSSADAAGVAAAGPLEWRARPRQLGP